MAVSCMSAKLESTFQRLGDRIPQRQAGTWDFPTNAKVEEDGMVAVTGVGTIDVTEEAETEAWTAEAAETLTATTVDGTGTATMTLEEEEEELVVEVVEVGDDTTIGTGTDDVTTTGEGVLTATNVDKAEVAVLVPVGTGARAETSSLPQHLPPTLTPSTLYFCVSSLYLLLVSLFSAICS